MNLAVQLVLLVLAFAAAFAVLWIGICLLISTLGGWRALGERFPELANRPEYHFTRANGRMRVFSYQYTMSVGFGPHHLHLGVIRGWKFGHRPLSIPRTALIDDGKKAILGTGRRVKIADGPGLTLYGKAGRSFDAWLTGGH